MCIQQLYLFTFLTADFTDYMTNCRVEYLSPENIAQNSPVNQCVEQFANVLIHMRHFKL